MTWLNLVLLFTLNFYLVSTQSNAEFERMPSIDNYMCVGLSYLFKDENCCRSTMECLAICQHPSNCHGVFYDHVSQTCLGCKENIRQGLVNTDLVPAAGSTKFYLRVRAITHGQPCSSSASCVTDQYCPVTDLCTCKPGYSYYAFMDNCNTQCSVYGNTYEEHPNKAISGYNVYVHDLSSPSQCTNECNNEPSCRTVDYKPNNCCIQQATALTAPGSWVELAEDIHYHRNCA